MLCYQQEVPDMGQVVSLELKRSTSVTGGWFLTKSRGMLVVCVPGALGVHGTSPGGGTLGKENRCL